MATRAPAEAGFEFEDLMTAVYKKLKELILNQYLEPGSKVRQEELARFLGVSRTPIIKALQRLASENLVAYTPRKGFTVKELTTREMFEIFYLRELLEGAVARETARKATDRELEEIGGYFARFGQRWDDESRARYTACDKAFHARLYEIAGIPLLLKVNEMFSIFRVSYQRGLLRDPSETLREHLALVEALRKRDEELAERLARGHISRSRATLLDKLDQKKGW